jgi:hypothetical protein
MGWNGGYTIFEATVVGAYDLGKLDKELLSVLMEPYRGSDIDSGGEMGLKAKDGLDVVEIVLKTFGRKLPEKPDLPDDYKLWTPAQDRANERYWDARSEAFAMITKKFGWR